MSDIVDRFGVSPSFAKSCEHVLKWLTTSEFKPDQLIHLKVVMGELPDELSDDLVAQYLFKINEITLDIMGQVEVAYGVQDGHSVLTPALEETFKKQISAAMNPWRKLFKEVGTDRRLNSENRQSLEDGLLGYMSMMVAWAVNRTHRPWGTAFRSVLSGMILRNWFEESLLQLMDDRRLLDLVWLPQFLNKNVHPYYALSPVSAIAKNHDEKVMIDLSQWFSGWLQERFQEPGFVDLLANDLYGGQTWRRFPGNNIVQLYVNNWRPFLSTELQQSADEIIGRSLRAAEARLVDDIIGLSKRDFTNAYVFKACDFLKTKEPSLPSDYYGYHLPLNKFVSNKSKIDITISRSWREDWEVMWLFVKLSGRRFHKLFIESAQFSDKEVKDKESLWSRWGVSLRTSDYPRLKPETLLKAMRESHNFAQDYLLVTTMIESMAKKGFTLNEELSPIIAQIAAIYRHKTLSAQNNIMRVNEKTTSSGGVKKSLTRL